MDTYSPVRVDVVRECELGWTTTDLPPWTHLKTDVAHLYNDCTVLGVPEVVEKSGWVKDTAPAGTDVPLGKGNGAESAPDSAPDVIPTHFINGDKASETVTNTSEKKFPVCEIMTEIVTADLTNVLATKS